VDRPLYGFKNAIYLAQNTRLTWQRKQLKEFEKYAKKYKIAIHDTFTFI